jgi:hypothetical protein
MSMYSSISCFNELPLQDIAAMQRETKETIVHKHSPNHFEWACIGIH